MSETGTLTLTDFLLARISEDEASARACTNRAWVWAGTSGSETVADMEHIGRHSPARVLAECEAKRRIVHYHTSDQYNVSHVEGLRPMIGTTAILEYLALPYADHPDYREEWRP